jgi:protein-S-isoprenylcysteine O-methyltransferase Ste14
MLGSRLFPQRAVWIGAAFTVGSWLSTQIYVLRYGDLMPLTGILSLPEHDLLFIGSWAAEWDPAMVWPLGLALLGFAIRAWASSYMGSATVHAREMQGARLVAGGPYRWVRNPLYLGLLVWAAGYAMFLPPPGIVLVLVPVGALCGLLARAEGAQLAERVEGYAEFAANVGSFVPRLRPWTPPEGASPTPNWRDGLLSEGWMLALAVYVLAHLTPARDGAAVAALAWLALWWVAFHRKGR